jgi:hypothetical protein
MASDPPKPSHDETEAETVKRRLIARCASGSTRSTRLTTTRNAMTMQGAGRRPILRLKRRRSASRRGPSASSIAAYEREVRKQERTQQIDAVASLCAQFDRFCQAHIEQFETETRPTATMPAPIVAEKLREKYVRTSAHFPRADVFSGASLRWTSCFRMVA